MIAVAQKYVEWTPVSEHKQQISQLINAKDLPALRALFLNRVKFGTGMRKSGSDQEASAEKRLRQRECRRARMPFR